MIYRPMSYLKATGHFLPLLAILLPTPAFAHAFGQRYDLPLPLSYYIVGGGIAVLASFIIMALVFVRPRDENELSIRQIASWPLDARGPLYAKFFLLEIPAVFTFAFLIYAGFDGFQRSPTLNILPTMVWVIWWVGFAFIAALVGNIWDAINPWSIIGRWVGLVIKALGWRPPQFAYPKWLSAWPAVILFAAFAWMEIAWPSRIVPAKLATVILVYSGITWVGMAWFGRKTWLAHGETFTMFFSTFSRFALFAGRASVDENGDGRYEILVRPPSVGLLGAAPKSLAHLTFILLIFSTVTFDGIAETPFWQGIADWFAQQDAIWPILLNLSYIMGGTAGVNLTLGFILVFSTFLMVYLTFALLIKLASGHSNTVTEVATLFVYSLVPIAIAYHLAHFLPFLLIFGQSIIPLISNPLGVEGVDIFGTADYRININLIGAKFSWIASALAIVIGHIAAVFVAHIMALRLFSGHRSALSSQLPMLILMIAYTMLSLWILAQPVVE